MTDPRPLADSVLATLIGHAYAVARFSGWRLSADDRDDAVQDALTAYIRRMRRGPCLDNPQAWVAGAVQNSLRLRARAAWRRRADISLADQRGHLDVPCLGDSWAALDELLETSGLPTPSQTRTNSALSRPESRGSESPLSAESTAREWNADSEKTWKSCASS